MRPKKEKPKGSGKDFKPGWKGGPGRPPLPSEVKAYRRMTSAQVTEIFAKFTDLSVEELQKYVVNKNNPETLKNHWMESYIASMIIKGLSTGDGANLSMLLDRMIGKPKMLIEATVIDESKKSRLEHSLDILKQILEERKSEAPDQYFAAGLLGDVQK